MAGRHLDTLKGLLTAQEGQSKYLIQSIELEETEPPELFTNLVYTLCGLTVAALIWAGITKVEETAQAEGTVVPLSDIQAIQHLEGGIISEIKVREGDTVIKGDTLIPNGHHRHHIQARSNESATHRHQI